MIIMKFDKKVSNCKMKFGKFRGCDSNCFERVIKGTKIQNEKKYKM